MVSYECPTCARVLTVDRREEAPYRPFCSERCRLIDLGRWFNEEYGISEPLDLPSGPRPPLDPPRPPESPDEV